MSLPRPDASPDAPMIHGYARVSTEDQSLAAQLTALQAAGCRAIHPEQASGGGRCSPRCSPGSPRATRWWSPASTGSPARCPTSWRSARRFVAEGLLPEAVLARARPKGSDRLARIAAGLRETRPGATLQDLCDALAAMGETPPRGAARWWPSTVRHLLQKAEVRGG